MMRNLRAVAAAGVLLISMSGGGGRRRSIDPRRSNWWLAPVVGDGALATSPRLSSRFTRR